MREVDVADAAEHVVDERRALLGVEGVERHGFHPLGAQACGARSRASPATSVSRAASTIVRARRFTSARKCRVRDVRSRSQHEHRLHRPQRILHVVLFSSVAVGYGRPSRRRRSDWRTPAGSTRERSSAKRSRSGYIDGEELGAESRVLGQVDTSADAGHELVEIVEQRGESGHHGGDVEREGPARRRERQRPRVLGTESFEHREERRRVRVAQHLDRATHRLGRVVGDDVLVLQEPSVPVEAVPVAYAVERVEERRRSSRTGRAGAARRGTRAR